MLIQSSLYPVFQDSLGEIAQLVVVLFTLNKVPFRGISLQRGGCVDLSSDFE